MADDFGVKVKAYSQTPSLEFRDARGVVLGQIELKKDAEPADIIDILHEYGVERLT